MKIHVVQKGDTWEKIAKRYGLHRDELTRANPNISKTGPLKVGNKVRVPVVSRATVKPRSAVGKRESAALSDKNETPEIQSEVLASSPDEGFSPSDEPAQQAQENEEKQSSFSAPSRSVQHGQTPASYPLPPYRFVSPYQNTPYAGSNLHKPGYGIPYQPAYLPPLQPLDFVSSYHTAFPGSPISPVYPAPITYGAPPVQFQAGCCGQNQGYAVGHVNGNAFAMGSYGPTALPVPAALQPIPYPGFPGSVRPSGSVYPQASAASHKHRGIQVQPVSFPAHVLPPGQPNREVQPMWDRDAEDSSSIV